MSKHEKVEPDVGIKTEFIGCYITEADKDMLASMSRFLHIFGYIGDINNSETLRFSINLCYWFVMQEIDKFFINYQAINSQQKPVSENNIP